jgi:inward rectifier potassium channel
MAPDNQSPHKRPRVGRERGVFRLGNSQIQRIGVGGRLHWGDLYHWVLTLSWSGFFALVCGIYIATNLVFAGAFYYRPDAVANARPGAFLDVVFFSIETLATVGYGYMHPATTYGHTVASLEIFLGMVEVAAVTGLLLARFSRPTSRILFSDFACITTFNGVPTLMVRTGNERSNLIIEATVHAALVRRETTLEGQMFTRFYDLKLEREQTSVFALSWTIMHTIDEASPLYGLTQKDLHDTVTTLTVSISGMDDTLNDFVHARQSYAAEHIYFGHHFVDILSDKIGDVRILDFGRFHDITADGETVPLAPRDAP